MKSKAAIRRAYDALKRLDPKQAQARGRRFEDVLYDMLRLESLRPSRNLRPPGQEIDLYFTDGCRHFLLEARWRKRVAPKDVYALQGKLEGKLVGTLGIFLSVGADFSEDAIKAMTTGRQLNTLLFSKEDFEYALAPGHSFRRILEVKLRQAACFGIINYAYKTFLDTQGPRS